MPELLQRPRGRWALGKARESAVRSGSRKQERGAAGKRRDGGAGEEIDVRLRCSGNGAKSLDLEHEIHGDGRRGLRACSSATTASAARACRSARGSGRALAALCLGAAFHPPGVVAVALFDHAEQPAALHARTW
jgi:hypothetical protein